MRPAVLRALSIPRFGAYAAGMMVSQVGTWTQQVAVSWLAWDLTGSEAWLGIVAFCQFVPALVVAPVAGALADRLDRLALAIVALALASAQAALLWALSVSDLLTIGPLLFCVLFLGTVTSLSLPTLRVVLRYLVPDELLPAAISLNSITLNIARFTGPALAGLFIYWDALELAFLLNALSYAAIILPLLGFRSAKLVETPVQTGPRPALFTDIREGVAYAWHDRYARFLLGVYLVYALLGRPAVDLLPAIVDRLLGGDSAMLALLTSIFGVVAIAGGLVLAGLTTRPQLETATRISIFLLAVGVAVLGFAPSLPVAMAAIVLYGAGQVTANITTQTLLQLEAEDRVRGRLMSLHFMMFRTGAALGSLAIGLLAEVMGLGPALLLASLGLFATFAALMAWRPNPRPTAGG